jgi:hypothetical protein
VRGARLAPSLTVRRGSDDSFPACPHSEGRNHRKRMTNAIKASAACYDCNPILAGRNQVVTRSHKNLRITRRSGILTQPILTQPRKQNYDEKSRLSRIDNDAGCDLRTGFCGHGRTEGAVLAQSDRPLRPASGLRLQCLRSGRRDSDGRAQCAPLLWRTEIELLTFDVLDMALASNSRIYRP